MHAIVKRPVAIGDKINRELRSEGANIVVTSRAAALTGGVGSINAGASGTAMRSTSMSSGSAITTGPGRPLVAT